MTTSTTEMIGKLKEDIDFLGSEIKYLAARSEALAQQWEACRVRLLATTVKMGSMIRENELEKKEAE